MTEVQEVEAGLRPERTLKVFKEAVERGYIHVKFVKTGTELGVRLDEESDLSGADFEKGQGAVRASGTLILDYVRVKCRAEIDLATLAGQGNLEVIEEVTPLQLAKERAERRKS